MRDELIQYFGDTICISEFRERISLPLFMTMRQIYKLELHHVLFMIVDVESEAEMSIAAMKNQKAMYEDELKCPVAYKLKISSIKMRNALVRNEIPFIDIPGNIFLPFLGTVLLDIHHKQILKTDKMMPATQLVYLDLFYREDNTPVTKSEIARRLGLTKTSLTRAALQLKEMGLLVEEKKGKEVYIKRNLPRRKYFDRAKNYLINPIQKVITIKRQESFMDFHAAGESALSILSELNPPRIPEYAIIKNHPCHSQFEVVDLRTENSEECMKVQLWKYDPAIFGNFGCVDVISMICTFEKNVDERIEMCIDTLLEEL